MPSASSPRLPPCSRRVTSGCACVHVCARAWRQGLLRVAVNLGGRAAGVRAGRRRECGSPSVQAPSDALLNLWSIHRRVPQSLLCLSARCSTPPPPLCSISVSHCSTPPPPLCLSSERIPSIPAVPQRLVLYSFPAICWAYGAGALFSSFVSVVFWTGWVGGCTVCNVADAPAAAACLRALLDVRIWLPRLAPCFTPSSLGASSSPASPLVRAVERVRNAATSVQPRQWHAGTRFLGQHAAGGSLCACVCGR